MRWGSIVTLLVVMAFAVGIGVVPDAQPSALAQDSTPDAEAREPAVFRPLAAGSIQVLAPGVANVLMGRVSLAPAASVPFDSADPSAILLYVSSGALTFSVDVPMTVARAGAGGTPTPPEEVAADTEFTLENGDSAIFPGSMSGEMRNDGAEEATAWVVNILHLAEASGTPTP
jgi:hypothetical protein